MKTREFSDLYKQLNSSDMYYVARVFLNQKERATLVHDFRMAGSQKQGYADLLETATDDVHFHRRDGNALVLEWDDCA